jgi:hypothetical protein
MQTRMRCDAMRCDAICFVLEYNHLSFTLSLTLFLLALQTTYTSTYNSTYTSTSLQNHIAIESCLLILDPNRDPNLIEDRIISETFFSGFHASLA